MVAIYQQAWKEAVQEGLIPGWLEGRIVTAYPPPPARVAPQVQLREQAGGGHQQETEKRGVTRSGQNTASPQAVTTQTDHSGHALCPGLGYGVRSEAGHGHGARVQHAYVKQLKKARAKQPALTSVGLHRAPII